MAYRQISKIHVSKLFWKDLGEWRNHADYWTIRRQIGEMVKRAAAGDDPGDKAFQNSRWAGIKHMHVAAKLIAFTSYDDDGAMRINALKKHDFYGFRNERRKMVDAASEKIRNAIAATPIESPFWQKFKWSDPNSIPGHPELPELAREALDTLLEELEEEAENLGRARRISDTMSPDEAGEFEDCWLNGLIEAMDAVQAEIIVRAGPRRSHLTPSDFDRWLEQPR